MISFSGSMAFTLLGSASLTGARWRKKAISASICAMRRWSSAFSRHISRMVANCSNVRRANLILEGLDMCLRNRLSGEFFGNAEFTGESVFDALGSSGPHRNAEHMGAAEAELSGGAGDDTAIERKLSQFPLRRGMLRCNLVAWHGNENIPIPMDVKSKMATAPKIDKPKWSLAIEAARKRAGLNQAQFAQRLGTTQSNVSKWESGAYQPTPDIYLQIAGMAAPEDANFFFVLAKLQPEQVERLRIPAAPPAPRPQPIIEVLPARGARNGNTLLKKVADVIAVPLLEDPAAAGSPRLIEEAKLEDTLLLPRAWCPHPESMVCIRVKGNSMSPILEEDYIAAMDTAVNERSQLYNKMVAARDPEGGVTIKWFRKMANGKEALIAQHTSEDYDPIIISDEPGWKLIGEVRWWVGHPQKSKKKRK